MGVDEDKIITVLQDMEQHDLLELKLYRTDASITFLVPREDDKTINPLRKEIESLIEKKKAQVASVLTYVENTTECKQLHLVRYFGEKNDEPCGICSFCIAENSSAEINTVAHVSEKIMEILNESPLDSRSIIETLNFTETEVLEVLRLLLDAGNIRLNAVNQYFVK